MSVVVCPNCNQVISNPSQPCPLCGHIVPANTLAAAERERETRGNNKMKNYKVLTQKDRWFSGKFSPDLLEGAINAYAEQGWRVIGCATADIPGLLGDKRQEMIVILERDE